MTFAQAIEWYRVNEPWVRATAEDRESQTLAMHERTRTAARVLEIRKSWEGMPYVPDALRAEFVDAVLTLRESRGAGAR